MQVTELRGERDEAIEARDAIFADRLRRGAEVNQSTRSMVGDFDQCRDAVTRVIGFMREHFDGRTHAALKSKGAEAIEQVAEAMAHLKMHVNQGATFED